MKLHCRRRFGAILLGAPLLGASGGPAFAQKTFQMAALAPASSATVFSVALSEILKREHDYRFQISTGTAATRQAVEAANQRLDLFVTAVSVNHYMQNKLKMYAKMDNAQELFKNLRGIVNYPFGAYQPLVWESSGITSLKQIKGKKVFTGPPSGAARPTCEGIVEGVAGFKPNQDYTRANLDWSSAQQAFRDGQIDVYFAPAPIPSPAIAELAALGKIRILPIEDASLDNPAIKGAASIPGRRFNFVPPGTYDNLVNTEPVRVLDSLIGLGTTKWMSEEDAYNITRAIFEHHADLVATASWMKAITPENAVAEMNMPLHKGAAKYYQEIGVTIPPAAQPVD